MDLTWTKTTVGNAYSYTSKPRNLKTNGDITFIPMEAISDKGERINNAQIKKVSTVTSGTYIENGDFILAKITPSFENGKQAVVNINDPYAYASTEVIPIKEIKDVSDKWYLAYWLRQKEIRSYLAGKMEGTTGRQRLNKTVLSNTEINLPPLKMQKQIVGILSEIQNAISSNEKLILRLYDLKRNMLHHLFTKGTKGEKTKTTDIGDMPESWDVVALKTIVPDIAYGVSQAIPKNKPEHGYKIVSTADITKAGEFLYDQLRYIDVKDTHAEKLRLKDGDVLFNWRNSLDHIGKTAIYTNHGDEHVIFASFILCLRCDEKKAHNRFISNLMNYYREKEVFSKLARRAVNQANYNRNEIYVLQIPSPSYEEQVEIADIIEKIDIKIKLAQKKLMLQQQLFSTLLHELMSGERRVKINA